MGISPLLPSNTGMVLNAVNDRDAATFQLWRDIPFDSVKWAGLLAFADGAFAGLRSEKKEARQGMLLGERLRLERLLAGKTRAELAAALAINERLLADYEEGTAKPDARRLVSAAAALDVPISFFCFDDARCKSPFAGDACEEMRWLALPRPLTVLSRAAFEPVEPIVNLWRATRGTLGEAMRLDQSSVLGRLPQRVIVVRRKSRSSRLITEHLSSGFAHILPCEGLWRIGRDLDEAPDRDYGAALAESYAETAWSETLRVESVRARVRTSSGTLLGARYDRVLLPWRGRGESFVMGVSLRRELAAIS